MINYEPFAIVIHCDSKQLKIEVVPLHILENKRPIFFEIKMKGKKYGTIHFMNGEWSSFNLEDKDLVRLIGTCIYKIYDSGDIMFKNPVPAKFSNN